MLVVGSKDSTIKARHRRLRKADFEVHSSNLFGKETIAFLLFCSFVFLCIRTLFYFDGKGEYIAMVLLVNFGRLFMGCFKSNCCSCYGFKEFSNFNDCHAGS